MLGRYLAGRELVYLSPVEYPVAKQYRGEAEEAANGDGQKHEPGLFDSEVVHADKRVAQASKEAKEDAKDHRYIEGEEPGNRLGEEHVNGSHEAGLEKHSDALAERRHWSYVFAALNSDSSLDDRMIRLPGRQRKEECEGGEEE